MYLSIHASSSHRILKRPFPYMAWVVCSGAATVALITLGLYLSQ